MTVLNDGGILTYQIEDIQKLHSSYLPFIKNGAIFVPISEKRSLGDQVSLSVILPGSTEQVSFQGIVVWINHRTQANRPMGFAVQLGSDNIGLNLKNEIERLLTGMTGSLHVTYTM